MSNNKARRKSRFATIAAVMASVMTLSVFGTSVLSASAEFKGTKFYADYNSMTEAKIAAEQVTREMGQEGFILLKNDGTLPLPTSSWVSVFGGAQDSLVGGTGSAEVSDTTVTAALANAGYKVNPTLEAFYATAGGGDGSETTSFNGAITSSFNVYNDAAIVVFSRSGGEGSDVATVTGEEATAADGQNHKALYYTVGKVDPPGGGGGGGGKGDVDAALSEGPGGEGGDPTALPGGEGQDWPSPDAPGGPGQFDPDNAQTHYKHGLMLTEAERSLIALAKANFKKVIVVLNTSNAMEVGELQDDDRIGGIIDICRPGVGGCNALADIISGAVSPSGGLVDEWVYDLTADPFWCNFGDNSQNQVGKKSDGNGGFTYATEAVGSTQMKYSNGTVTGSAGTSTNYNEGLYYLIDYEEGIYLGYRYYETVYAELVADHIRYDSVNNELVAKTAIDDEGYNATEKANEWYNRTVLYPYGYGLNYTSFSFNAGTPFYFLEDVKTELGATVNKSLFESSVGHVAQVETIFVPVTVKNTGNVAGKKTVQVYVESPYTAGGIEKAAHVLVGFAKTDVLAPGASQELLVEVQVQDFASYDAEDKNENGAKTYELDAGKYVIRVMENSHFNAATIVEDTGDAYDQIVFNLDETAVLELDDFSGNKLENILSIENGTYDADTEAGDLAFYSVRTAEMMADNTSGMTVLSRADLIGTFPKAPTEGDVRFKDNIIDNYAFWENFTVDEEDLGGTSYIYNGTYPAQLDREDYPWYKTNDDIPSNWTQATGTYDENYRVTYNRTTMNWPMYVTKAADCPIKFADMAGVAYDDPKWDEFLNQLTYDELCTVVEFGGYCVSDLPSVGKLINKDTDGPNNLDSTHQWCSEDLIASTFNVDLANKEGIVMGNLGLLHGVQGWYAPGADQHRSAFSGRNNEYYSQDPFHSGTIGAAVIQGVQSKGIVCYIKHIFINDQETNRGADYEFVTEQAIREVYARQFQMCLQEGDCKAAMTGYGHIAGFCNTANYNIGTKLYQEQWGVKTYFVTDGYIGWRTRTSLDIMVRTGIQMELYTTPFVEYLSGEWDATLRNGKGGVLVGNKIGADGNKSGGTTESATQWYCVRKSAQGILYQISNMSAQYNGYSELELSGGKLDDGTQGVSYSANVAAANGKLSEGSTAKYSATGLPEGLTLSESGTISGTPKTAGDYRFTVKVTIDGYVEKEVDYTMTVKSAFAFDSEGDAINAAKVGEEFFTAIVCNSMNKQDYQSFVYTIAEGRLPAGVSLTEAGEISGTPTEAGSFTVKVKLTATKEEQQSSGKGKGEEETQSEPKITITEADFTFTMVVAAGAPAPAPEYEENVPYIKDGKWYINGKDTGAKVITEAEVKAAVDAAVAAANANTEKKGCGGVIGVGAGILAVITMLGAAVIVRKKED